MVAEYVLPTVNVLGGLHSNRENRRESRRNRQFQERMANTAYQRAVKDMKLAGINPMLASKLGGAATPAGGQATSFNSAANVASDYTATAANKELVKQTRAQTQNVAKDTLLKDAQIQTQKDQQNYIRSQTRGQDQTNAIRQPAADATNKTFNEPNIIPKGIEAINTIGSNAGDAAYELSQAWKRNKAASAKTASQKNAAAKAQYRKSLRNRKKNRGR